MIVYSLPSPPSYCVIFFNTFDEKVSKEAANGVPKAGNGTSAEDWVPKGNTAPRGDGEDGVTSMDVDEPQADGGEGEEDKGDGVGDVSNPPLALLEVMISRNGCKLLLRLLAPERTG